MPNGVRARGNSRIANQRRNIIEDRVIHATTIIENAETVIIQAQEHDTSELDTRILQLENEIKVMKTQNKKDKQQNKRVMGLIKDKLKTCSDNFENIMRCLTTLNMLSVNSTANNITIKGIDMKYQKIVYNGNPEDCKYKIKGECNGDFKKIQAYVDKLEMIIANNKLSLDCMCDLTANQEPTLNSVTEIITKMGNKSCDNNPKFYENSEGLVRGGGVIVDF